MSDALSTLTCPRCLVPLREHSLGSVTIDGCETCGGLWFDTDELSRLAQGGQATVVAAEGVFDPPHPAADLLPVKGLCPRCQVPLYAFQFEHTPGVTLDACPTCRGVWIDDGELEAIGRRLAPTQPAAAPQTTERPVSVRQKARRALQFIRRVPCSKCGEENPDNTLVCWACGAPMSRRKTHKLCPRCDNNLDYVTADDLEIHPPPFLDHCPDCGGIWIQRESLSPLIDVDIKHLKRWEEHLMAHVRGALATKEDQPILCPVCQVALEEHPYARDESVLIDQCRTCLGVWLDSGELVLIKRVSLEQDVWGRSDDL
jgi:uncharacterized protein